jgi:hypothetical protein
VKVKKDKQSADSPLLEQRRQAAAEAGRRGNIPTSFSLLYEVLKVQNTVYCGRNKQSFTFDQEKKCRIM